MKVNIFIRQSIWLNVLVYIYTWKILNPRLGNMKKIDVITVSLSPPPF